LSIFLIAILDVMFIVLVALIKNKYLSERWSKRIIYIAFLLIFVFISIPIEVATSRLILGALYGVVFVMVVPTDKINFLK
jgi:hypothetical protein